MKRFKIFVSFFIISILLCSCKFTSFDADTLLSPPKMNADDQQIRKVISDTCGGNYILIYPQNGSYQTAINSVDITPNEGNEAVCFYTAANEKDVSFIVLEERDGKWAAVSKLSSQSSAIDKVSFSDLNGDGYKEIIIGWRYLTGEEKAIEVFSLDKNYEIKSVYTGIYNNFITYEDSVVIISRNATGKTANATLLGHRDGVIEILNTVVLNNAITGFISVQSGYIGSDRVIYIDEKLESSLYTTEILTLTQSSELLLSNANADINMTRTRAYTCIDVSGDGNPDLPVEVPLSSYIRGDTEENLSYVDWYKFTLVGTEYIKSSYTSLNEQFYFEIPKQWIGNITIERDSDSERSISFYLASENKKAFMFTLRVFSQQEFSELAQNQGFKEISTANENVYAFRESTTQLPNEYKVDSVTAKEKFNLIT